MADFHRRLARRVAGLEGEQHAALRIGLAEDLAQSLEISTGWILANSSCWATVLAGKPLSKRMMIDTTLPPLQLASTR